MTAVSDLKTEIERAEQSYEYLIAYAGKGLDRQESANATPEVRDYVEQLADALEEGMAAARRIPEEYEIDWGEELLAFLEGMDEEVDQARTVLALTAAQERITSVQVDNMNGFSVFQSVVMKLFFLDELTAHLDWDGTRGPDGEDDG